MSQNLDFHFLTRWEYTPSCVLERTYLCKQVLVPVELDTTYDTSKGLSDNSRLLERRRRTGLGGRSARLVRSRCSKGSCCADPPGAQVS